MVYEANAPRYTVAYYRCRHSSQPLKEIESQRRCIEEFCENYNIKIVREYVEITEIGAPDHRNERSRLLHDAKENPEWDMVLLSDPSRFTRSMKEYHRYIDSLNSLGIELVSAAEGDNYSSAWFSHLARMFEMVGESPEK